MRCVPLLPQLVRDCPPCLVQGSLRAALESRLLAEPCSGRPHYASVLGLALGVARAMHHLHSAGVLHGDLKVGMCVLCAAVITLCCVGTSARLVMLC